MLSSLITGAGRGIGRAVAMRLADEGPVILVGRTSSDLDSVRDMIRAKGGRAESCVGDVAEESTGVRALAIAAEQGWEIHNLICNAGIGKNGPTESFDIELWYRIFDVNVHGSFRLIQACLPEMLRRGQGTICLMSSTAGLRGLAYDAAYTTTKHALIGLARSLAAEYDKRGLVIVPICPGFVAGEMTDRAIRGLMERGNLTEAEATRKIAETNSGRRIIPAEEVAEAVALLCSGKLPSLNGNPLIMGGKG